MDPYTTSLNTSTMYTSLSWQHCGATLGAGYCTLACTAVLLHAARSHRGGCQSKPWGSLDPYTTSHNTPKYDMSLKWQHCGATLGAGYCTLACTAASTHTARSHWGGCQSKPWGSLDPYTTFNKTPKRDISLKLQHCGATLGAGFCNLPCTAASQHVARLYWGGW